jgi:predicted CopG family antitoxin
MTILNPTSIIAGLLALLFILQTQGSGLLTVLVAGISSIASAMLALYGQQWLFRRKNQTELEKSSDQSYTELGHVVLELTDKERGRLEAALDRVARRAEEVHAKELQFLQEQLRHRTNLEIQARNRTHDALSEVQRCVLTLREHEELMRKKGIGFEPFVFKTYDEILGEDKIPTIPDGHEVID